MFTDNRAELEALLDQQEYSFCVSPKCQDGAFQKLLHLSQKIIKAPKPGTFTDCQRKTGEDLLKWKQKKRLYKSAKK